jgi:hypothetical protein
MPKDPAKFEDCAQEQTTKSLFFHQKLHEWGLLEVARAIEAFDGSRVEWNLQDLCISEHAWNRVIHGGIAPVRVFAHPAVLQSIARSVLLPNACDGFPKVHEECGARHAAV